MIVGRIDRASFAGASGVKQQQKGFQGLSPEFFGPPSRMDQMKDTGLAKSLGIDTQGMNRLDVKANILSKLTGKSVDDMKSFYSTISEQDMKNDMQTLSQYGIEASAQPDLMMARAENKAMIASQWIQEASGSQNETSATQQNQTQSTEQTQSSQQQQSGGSPPSLPSALLAILSQLGITPTGSKSGDYSAVMSKLASMEASATSDTEKQSIDTTRQNFIAVFASL